MRNRVTIVLAILFVATVALLLSWNTRDHEPVYQGIRLGAWLDDLTSPTPDLRASATNAIRHMGTNAIPALLQEASARQSFPKAILTELMRRQPLVKFHIADHQARALAGFRALGTTGALGLAEGFTNQNKWIRFGCVGQWEMCSDYPAILFPPLFDCLKDEDPLVRSRAANAVGLVHLQPEKVVPVLTEMLSDPNKDVRSMAALGLCMYGTQATSAVPTLLKQLTNSGPEFQFWGTNALKAIDPAAAARVGIK